MNVGNLPQIPRDEVEAQFRAFMRENNCEPIDNITLNMDDKIERFRVLGDKKSETTGAYRLSLEGWPHGWCQNWREGKAATWSFNRDIIKDSTFKKSLTDEALKQMIKQSKAHQAEMQKQLENRQLEASDKARLLFKNLKTSAEDSEQAYLKEKRIKSYGLKLQENNLVVPLYDINGNFKSIQFISPDGTKKFFPEAPVKGAFFSIAADILKPEKAKELIIIICEGMATGATIYEMTSMPTFAAMNCGNLFEVAKGLKAKYPQFKIVIAADNDHKTKGNPGLTTANDVCKKLNLNGVVYPIFTEHETGTDWNDYFDKHGEDKTREYLMSQIKTMLIPEAIRQKLNRIEQINGNELLKKKFNPLKWAIEGMIPSGCSILAGAPKVGKSRLSLNLCLAVAVENGCALGCIDVVQGEVLYLALEDTQRRLQERILDAQLGDDVDLSNLTVITNIPRQHEGGMEYIKWWLEEHPKARLVVIDTLQRFRKQLSGKGDRYAEDYDVVSEIKSVADKYDVPILIVHHLTKAKDTDDWLNEISGSMGIVGAADTIFSLKRARTNMYGILHRTGRDVEEKDFSLKLEEFGWILTDEVETFTMPEWKRNIIQYLKEHESVSTSELAEALNLEPNTAKQHLFRLEKSGTLTKESRGRYKLPD